MALSRKLPQECPENDGMNQLRHKIQKIHHSNLSHEEMGKQLLSLMNAAHCGPLQPMADDIRKGLPQATIIQPRLTELPVELLENIIFTLDLPSLQDLRLTCKALRAKSSHHFRRCYFTKRVVRTDWNSLRTLLMIANHEELGSDIRDLIIDCPEGNARPLGHRLPAAPNGGRSLARTPFHAPAKSSPQHLNVLLERILERIGSLHSLSFKSLTLIPRRDPLTDAECSAEVLGQTLRALSASPIALSSLSIGADEPSHCSFFSLREIPDDILATHSSRSRVFTNIHTLNLIFHIQDLDLNHGASPPKFPSNLLNITPNLQVLELHLAPNTSLTSLAVFNHIAKSTSLTKLKKVTLGSLALDTALLRTFLSASKSTLRQVYLFDICLVPQMNLFALRMYLAGELTLEKAELSNLHDVDDISGEPKRLAYLKLVDGVWV